MAPPPESPPLRIVILSAAFFPRPTGAVYSAIRLACALREKGHQLSFIVDDRGPEWRHGGEYEGFPVRSFVFQQSGKLKKLRGLLKFTLHIWRQRRSFDVFHISGGGYVNLFLACWVRVVTGGKVNLKITSDGWDTPDGATREKWGRLIAHCYRRLDGVVAMTSGQADKCRKWGFPGLLCVIPNGVDTTKYRPVTPEEKRRLRLEIGIPDHAVVLAYLGWLGHGKGTDVLLKTWASLRRTHPELLLLTVGDYLDGTNINGPMAEFLRTHDLSPDLLRSPDWKHVGRVPDAEKYLQASDLFCFPSRREGFGTVQIEAMACGLPCVVNDLPGVSADIFPDETAGFRIANNNVEAYVQALSDLIAHPEKRNSTGRAARDRVVQCFSREVVATRYAAYFTRLMNSAHQPADYGREPQGKHGHST